MGRSFSCSARQIQGSIDQGDVRERLREVSQKTAATGIILFRQQADVIAQRKQPFEQHLRFCVPSLQHQVVSQPETAGEEGPLAWRQAIVRSASVIAQQQPID